MNMDERMKLPDGFRFNPFEKELINSYLKPKVLGEKLPCNVVEERQLYGPNANPWQVFDPKNHPWIEHEVSCGKFEKLAYVFVNLTKKAAPNSVKNKNNGGREQFIKKAGCGCWDGQTSRTEIRDSNGDLIGEKRLLVFEVNDVSNQEDCTGVGYWRMHEYSLCGVNTNIPNTTHTVLCKITLDSSKNPPIKLKINQGKPQPQKKNNNKMKNTKSVLVNVSSPSTLNCAVVDAHVEGISQNCGPKGEETDVDVEWINSIYDQEEDGLGIGSSLLGQVDTGPVSFDRPKGEDLFYESDVVKTCDDVEWMNSIYDQEDGLGIVSSLLEEVDTGPVSFDYCWPAKHDNGYQISAREEAQGYEFDITSYLEPTYEQLLEDFTTNLGKRKLQAGCSPFLGIEKGQEARVFNDPRLDPRRCSQVILKHMYLLNQGQSFTKVLFCTKQTRLSSKLLGNNSGLSSRKSISAITVLVLSFPWN